MTTQSATHHSASHGATLPACAPCEMPAGMRSALNCTLAVLLLLNAAIFAAFPILIGASSSDAMGNRGSGPKVVSDSGDRVRITVSSQWTVQSDPTYLLYVVNEPAGLGVGIFGESKADLKAFEPQYRQLEGYSQLLSELLLKELTGGTQTAPVRTTVGGMAAIQCEITGTADGVQLTILHTVIEAPDTFYQVRALTRTLQFPSARGEFAEITSSFRPNRTSE